MADNSENELQLPNKRGFRCSSEMIQNLINFLTAYKAKMEYQEIDFDGGRAAQYKELRTEMAKLYEIEDVTLFGPASLSMVGHSFQNWFYYTWAISERILPQ